MADETPKFDLFRQFEVFDGLTAEDLDEIAGCSELLVIETGTDVLEEGGNDRHLYCLLDGEVEVLKQSLSGEQERITVLEPPAAFGELGLTVGAPRTATVRTTQSSEFLRVDGDEFHELQLAHHQSAYKVEHNVLRIMARRLGDSNRRTVVGLAEES